MDRIPVVWPESAWVDIMVSYPQNPCWEYLWVIAQPGSKPQSSIKLENEKTISMYSTVLEWTRDAFSEGEKILQSKRKFLSTELREEPQTVWDDDGRHVRRW